MSIIGSCLAPKAKALKKVLMLKLHGVENRLKIDDTAFIFVRVS